MKLDAYIKETNTSEQHLADATGYSQATINRLRRGKLNPTLELLSKISVATNGAVTPNDFLPDAPSNLQGGA